MTMNFITTVLAQTATTLPSNLGDALPDAIEKPLIWIIRLACGVGLLTGLISIISKIAKGDFKGVWKAAFGIGLLAWIAISPYSFFDTLVWGFEKIKDIFTNVGNEIPTS